MLIRANSVITPKGEEFNLVLRVENGLISEVSHDENSEVDLVLDGTLIPGFVDIHCHGGGGHYFSAESPLEISKAIALHRSHGTTTLMASLVTAPLEILRSQIQRLVPFITGGEIDGIHLEGPYLSPLRCGAHDPALLRTPEVGEIQELLTLGQGAIKMITIAPELPNAIEAIKFLDSQGVIAALGHTEADTLQMQAGIEAGGKVITHFHNAMQKFEEGKKTTANHLREFSRIPLELILDGVHVSSEISKDLLLNISERTILVTDAMSAAGCSDGHYSIGALDVLVTDSVARLESNGSLAGSTLTMDKAFSRAIEQGTTLAQAVAMSSRNAADLFGWIDRGRIEVGARADLLLISKGRDIEVVEVSR